MLPPEIEGLSAWYGLHVAHRAEWVERLSSAELTEIEDASERLAQTAVDWQTLRPEDFPLPTLKGRLTHILEEVLEGRGFVLLRGLPVERWGQRFSAVAFLGLGLHLGNLRPQNKDGHLLGHVKDMGLTSQDPNVRIYQRAAELSYGFLRRGWPSVLAPGQVQRPVESGQLGDSVQRDAEAPSRSGPRALRAHRDRSARRSSCRAEAVLLHTRVQLAATLSRSIMRG
jgi:hypothetical protein